MAEIILAGMPVTKASDTAKRFSGLFWGDAGSGKTVLAATLPGRKLVYEFDYDGAASIANVDNVDVVDLSELAPAQLATQIKNENNCMGINNVIDDYDSFIFDGMSNLTDKTLTVGIKDSTGASIEHPDTRAYGTRNALAIRLVKNIMVATRRKNKHVVFTAHEGAPTTDQKTNIILHISIALGGQLPNNFGGDFSEVWAIYQVDGRPERRIAIRPSRKRKPMKTRMFVQGGEPEFDFAFNAEDWNNPKNIPFRIDTWFDLWQKTGNKLPLPGTKEFDKLIKEHG